MNLKSHLLLQIILIAIVCLLATGSYVLFQVNHEVNEQGGTTLDAAGKYLEVQLSGINPNVQQLGRFPDFELWKQAYPASGVCLRYVPSNPRTSAHTLCQGESMPINHWPYVFETIYRSFFSMGIEFTRPIRFKGVEVGSITVIPSGEMELAKAWDRIQGLLGLAASMTIVVCAWVYLAIHRALGPAQTIVNSLEQMQHDDSRTLPDFKLFEWHRIGSAINHYAATQKQLLCDRKKLVMQLMTVQEEERAFLARELHDELGQCLTGINALSASVVQTAQQSCPKILTEVESIARINRRIMDTVRTLLVRLRPAELEELGLEASLHTMIEDWSRQQLDRIVCHLSIHTDCQRLKPPLPIVLFRIVQEGITNIAKHADATSVVINLETEGPSIALTIEDNGKLDVFPLPSTKGLGLLGIRERVTGLGGTFELSKSPLSGLKLQINLPAPADESLIT